MTFLAFFMLTMTAISMVMIPGMIICWVMELRQFKRDERNPYRRYCVDCGARHEVITIKGFQRDWWECQDEGCENCRRYSRDDILPGW